MPGLPVKSDRLTYLTWKKKFDGRPANCSTPSCPGYSVISLRNKAALQKANITHVVSVLRMRPDENLTEGFQQLKIEVDDVDDEDLLQYFASANAFIQAGLDAGGGVLVHWSVFLFSLTPPSYVA